MQLNSELQEMTEKKVSWFISYDELKYIISMYLKHFIIQDQLLKHSEQLNSELQTIKEKNVSFIKCVIEFVGYSCTV